MKNGRPIDIKPYERNTATKMIEDFMLLANETVAEEYFWRETSVSYTGRMRRRMTNKIKTADVHLINNFGYHIHVGNECTADGDYRSFLEKPRGRRRKR